MRHNHRQAVAVPISAMIDKTVEVAAAQRTAKHDQPCRRGSCEKGRANPGIRTDNIACFVSLHIDMVESLKRAHFKAEKLHRGGVNRSRQRYLTNWWCSNLNQKQLLVFPQMNLWQNRSGRSTGHDIPGNTWQTQSANMIRVCQQGTFISCSAIKAKFK